MKSWLFVRFSNREHNAYKFSLLVNLLGSLEFLFLLRKLLLAPLHGSISFTIHDKALTLLVSTVPPNYCQELPSIKIQSVACVTENHTAGLARVNAKQRNTKLTSENNAHNNSIRRNGGRVFRQRSV